MRNLIIIWVLIECFAVTQLKAAPSQKVDSLMQLIAVAEEKDKPRLCNKIAWQLRNSDMELSSKYANKALALARKYDDFKNITSSLNVLGLNHLFKNEMEQAFCFFEEEIRIGLKNNYEYPVGNGYLNIGLIYYQRSEYKQARLNFEKAEIHHKKTKSIRSLAIIQINFGLINFKTGDYISALDSYHQADKIYTNNPSIVDGRGALLNNIGDVYYALHDYTRALIFYNEAIEINTKFNDERRLCTSLRMAGKTRAAVGDYLNAHAYLNQALNCSIKLGDKMAEAECRKENVKILIAERNFEEASLVIESCYFLIDTLKNDALKSEVFYASGLISVNEMKYKKAEQEFLEALKYAVSINVKDLIANIYRSLYNLYNEVRNYKKAAFYTDKYLSINDSLMNEGIIQVISAHERYEREESEKKIAYYKYENVKLENETKSSKAWVIKLSAGFGGIIGFLVLWYLNHLSKEKSIQLLNKVKEEVNQQRILNLLKNQEIKSIKARIEGEESERARLAKELHDGIGGALGSIRLELTAIDHATVKDSVLELLNMVDAVYEEVRSISKHLTPLAIRDSSFTELINDYLVNLSSKSNLKASFIYYPEKLLNTLDDAIKTDIYRVVQELTNNVIKHAHARAITVQLIIHDDYINLLFEDDGDGFHSFKSSKGIGLSNIKSRIRLLNGNLEIDSRPGNGTVINVDIPQIKNGAYEKSN